MARFSDEEYDQMIVKLYHKIEVLENFIKEEGISVNSIYDAYGL